MRYDTIMRQDNIYDLLKADHQAVKELFERMTTIQDNASRTRLVAQLKQLILVHSEVEDQVFYRPLKAAESTREIIIRAEEEHRVVSRLLGELERLNPENERWSARLTVLKEMVEHHVGEEEGEIFKKAKQVFDRAQERAIAARFITEKRRSQAALSSADEGRRAS